MSRPSGRPATAPCRAFRCTSCGYAASGRSQPRRCPIRGGSDWEERGWRPFAAPGDDLTAALEQTLAADASAPGDREAEEVDAASILPGVPFSRTTGADELARKRSGVVAAETPRSRNAPRRSAV